jgi:hypothetical protein
MPSNATTIGPKTQTHGDAIFDAVFEHALHFRIEMSYEDARQFIRRIDQYNDFQAETVLDTLDRIDRLIPRKFYGEGNPNNGERSYTVSVGREGSPVLYLERYEWADDQPLSDDLLSFVCREMEIHGLADEADYEATPTIGNNRKITFRFWWD